MTAEEFSGRWISSIAVCEWKERRDPWPGLASPTVSGSASKRGEVMRLFDGAGYLASVLVVMAFCMRDIVPLRLIALGSNVAFLVYGIALDLAPVWLLHAILLPINGWRLWEAISRHRRLQRPAVAPTSYEEPHDDKGGLPCGS